jgi:hypothetical protein
MILDTSGSQLAARGQKSTRQGSKKCHPMIMRIKNVWLGSGIMLMNAPWGGHGRPVQEKGDGNKQMDALWKALMPPPARKFGQSFKKWKMSADWSKFYNCAQPKRLKTTALHHIV